MHAADGTAPAQRVAGRLARLNLPVVPESIVIAAGAEWGLARLPDTGDLRLVVAPLAGADLPVGLEGDRADGALVGPTSPSNAAILRERIDWLRPRPLGLRTSAGLGDRLGLATPGHVKALRHAGRGIAPIFAQQSIREMTRTHRTPAQVMDDATWGMLAAGWHEGAGADADHLKTHEDVDRTLAVGFTLFTIDPGAHVDPQADRDDAETLRVKVAALPWEDLDDTEVDLRRRYLQQTFEADDLRVTFGEDVLLRAAAKYGRAVAHVVGMVRYLGEQAGPRPVEVEISVDETETPTTPAEHFWVASELKRLGVAWVSLAPRFVGRFEKGIDYIGDLETLEADVRAHAAVARALGPYKLSLHSGSDKFSVYPIAADATGGLVHLKTAGTSYLEALRTVAGLDADLFREIYALARDRYDTDRATYHVSAETGGAPAPADVADEDLPGLLDHVQARQILHVTFGSVLDAETAEGSPRFRTRLMTLLRTHPEAYADALDRHFSRHLAPFAR